MDIKKLILENMTVAEIEDLLAEKKKMQSPKQHPKPLTKNELTDLMLIKALKLYPPNKNASKK